MTSATLSATLTAADILLNGIDSTARFAVKATRLTARFARAAWPIAQTTGILMLAIALFLGFKAYEMGEAFRIWCDRLVAESQQVKIAGYLMPADGLPNSDIDAIAHRGFLKTLTLKELLAEAEMYEIEIPRKAKKAQIIDLLIAAL